MLFYPVFIQRSIDDPLMLSWSTFIMNQYGFHLVETQHRVEFVQRCIIVVGDYMVQHRIDRRAQWRNPQLYRLQGVLRLPFPVRDAATRLEKPVTVLQLPRQFEAFHREPSGWINPPSVPMDPARNNMDMQVLRIPVQVG